MKKNYLFILFLILLSISAKSFSQSDEDNKKYRSIKQFTLGEKPKPNSNIRTNYNEHFTNISVGNLDSAYVRIFFNDSNCIYKLMVKQTSICKKGENRCMEEMKEFRELVEDYYDLDFNMLPVKSETYKKNEYDKTLLEFIKVKYTQKTYIRICSKQTVRYELKTIHLDSQSKSPENYISWGIEFTMTDTELEKEKQQADKLKEEKMKEKAKDNF